MVVGVTIGIVKDKNQEITEEKEATENAITFLSAAKEEGKKEQKKLDDQTIAEKDKTIATKDEENKDLQKQITEKKTENKNLQKQITEKDQEIKTHKLPFEDQLDGAESTEIDTLKKKVHDLQEEAKSLETKLKDEKGKMTIVTSSDSTHTTKITLT